MTLFLIDRIREIGTTRIEMPLDESLLGLLFEGMTGNRLLLAKGGRRVK